MIRKITILLTFAGILLCHQVYGYGQGKKEVDFRMELGAGQFAYVGGEYHFSRLPVLPLDTVGFTLGYTFLTEDKVHVWEPSLYASTSLGGGFSCRGKIGKLRVISPEYSASGSAWTAGLDFIWQFTPVFFIDLSLPYVMGEQGNEFTPCLGLGFAYALWKEKRP